MNCEHWDTDDCPRTGGTNYRTECAECLCELERIEREAKELALKRMTISIKPPDGNDSEPVSFGEHRIVNARIIGVEP